MYFFLALRQSKSTNAKPKKCISAIYSKKSYEYAKSLEPRKIYILSAKYGVLELSDEIEPYELTLNKMSKKQQKEWAYKCYKQLQSKGTDFNEQAVFLCGENYRKYLSQLFKNKIIPLEGISFGNQLKFYKNEVRKPQ